MDKKDRRYLTYDFSHDFVQALKRSGVNRVVVSPGFRNSPLLLALHRSKTFEIFTAIDERGGAFLALGMAKGTRSPVALVCTSGTAVANYFPAVLEASHSFVPLVVITADRPRELIGSGANQCMNQVNLFGDFVRKFLDKDPPTGPQNLQWVSDAVKCSLVPTPGPVHLNLRFDEPFFPTMEMMEAIEATVKPIANPIVSSTLSKEQNSSENLVSLNQLRTSLQSAKRPLVFLGAEELSERSLFALDSWAAKLNVPVLAEMASGFPLRDSKCLFLWRADAVANELAQEKIYPDLILRVGCGVTGRALGRLIQMGKPALYSIDYPSQHRNPELGAITTIAGDLNCLESIFESEYPKPIIESDWIEQLKSIQTKKESQLVQVLKAEDKFTEWHFYHSLAIHSKEASQFFLGNSMPIRDFNSVFPPRKATKVASNRGLSGIDGLIASSIGYASAHTEPTHAILGDLSFLHDLNSLSLLSSLPSTIDLTFWMINNGGGEIFRQVQTKSYSTEPEIFTTPKSFQLEKIAEAFSLPYFKIESTEQLERYLRTSTSLLSPRIVEILVDQTSSTAIRAKA